MTRMIVLAATLVVVLALAGGIAFRNDGRSEPDGVREFRAARPLTTKHDGVADTLRRIIDRAADDDAAKPELVQTLLDALNREGMGDPRQREGAAKQIIGKIMDAAAEFKGERGGSNKMRQRALDQQTSTLMRELHQTTRQATKASLSFGPRPEGFSRLRWDELTDIPYEEGDSLPEHVRSLDGERVAMAGYLVEGAFDELLLVKSVWGCCFGEPPAIHEAVVVTVSSPAESAWFEGVVRVVGPLDVGPKYEDGHLLSIYRLHAVQVDTLH